MKQWFKDFLIIANVLLFILALSITGGALAMRALHPKPKLPDNCIQVQSDVVACSVTIGPESPYVESQPLPVTTQAPGDETPGMSQCTIDGKPVACSWPPPIPYADPTLKPGTPGGPIPLCKYTAAGTRATPQGKPLCLPSPPPTPTPQPEGTPI